MVAPARMQLNIKVPIEAKERLLRCAAFYDRSVTRLLEMAADQWELRTLERLAEAQRPLYLAGTLRGDQVLSNWPAIKKIRSKNGQAIPVAVLSALVTADAKQKLRRFADFYGISLTVVIDRLSENYQKAILAQLSDKQQQVFWASKLKDHSREVLIEPIEAAHV